MKPFTTLKWLTAAVLISFNVLSASAQTKADIFDKNVPVTWLGVDYSLTTFIGTPTYSNFAFSAWTVVKKTGEGVVTKEEFRDTFLEQWNQLFIDEPKKYDVAKAIGRSEITYAIDVCVDANKKLTNKEFFSNDPADFHKLTETAVIDAVKKYDFKGKEGLGMMYFVEA